MSIYESFGGQSKRVKGKPLKAFLNCEGFTIAKVSFFRKVFVVTSLTLSAGPTEADAALIAVCGLLRRPFGAMPLHLLGEPVQVNIQFEFVGVCKLP